MNITVGNSEIVNMLVMDQVQKMQARVEELVVERDKAFSYYTKYANEIRDRILIAAKGHHTEKVMAVTKAMMDLRAVSNNPDFCVEYLVFKLDISPVHYMIDGKHQRGCKPAKKLKSTYNVDFHFEKTVGESKWISIPKGINRAYCVVAVETTQDQQDLYALALAEYSKFTELKAEIKEIEAQLSNVDNMKNRVLAEVTRASLEQNQEEMQRVAMIVDRLKAPLQITGE